MRHFVCCRAYTPVTVFWANKWAAFPKAAPTRITLPDAAHVKQAKSVFAQVPKKGSATLEGSHWQWCYKKQNPRLASGSASASGYTDIALGCVQCKTAEPM